MRNKKTKLFKQISVDTWDRFIFSKQANIKYSEITITENLLFKMQQYNTTNPNHPIKIYEAKNESTNGNDLEIYLEISKDKYIILVIQAKRIYLDTLKYKSISHKVAKVKSQIILLEDYAKRNNAIPLYLFYNYMPDFDKKYYGCSLVCAHYIKEHYYSSSVWKIPTFNDLHLKINKKRHALPLLFLGLPQYFKKFIEQECKSICKTNILCEIDNSNWRLIDNLSRKRKVKLSEDPDYTPEFKPKYRVVINKEEDQSE